MVTVGKIYNLVKILMVVTAILNFWLFRMKVFASDGYCDWITDTSDPGHFVTSLVGPNCPDRSAPVPKCPKDSSDLSAELSCTKCRTVPSHVPKCLGLLLTTTVCSMIKNAVRSHFVQELSSSWDGRPFGHRHGLKSGGCCAPFWGARSPSNTMRPGLRPIPPFQVASWSIQPFDHNRHGPNAGRVG